MIQSLDNAWKWYTAVRSIAHDVKHPIAKARGLED